MAPGPKIDKFPARQNEADPQNRGIIIVRAAIAGSLLSNPSFHEPLTP